MIYNIDARKTSVVGLMSVVMMILMSFMFIGVAKADDGIVWELANDTDFKGEKNGQFKYIGDAEYVEIPHMIKGEEVTSYKYMFREYDGNQLKGVKSTNKKVTDMSGMFHYASGLTELDLSNFDTSKVTNMSGMFAAAEGLTEFDLSNFDTSKVTNTEHMFEGASATKGYARTQADADKLNNSSYKPEGLVFEPTIESDILEGQVEIGVNALPGAIQLSIEESDFKGSEATIDVTKDNLTFKNRGSFTYKIEDNRGSEEKVGVKLSMSEFKHENGNNILSSFNAKFDNYSGFEGRELDLGAFDPTSGTNFEEELTLKEISFGGTKGKFIKSGKYKSTITVELQNVGSP